MNRVIMCVFIWAVGLFCASDLNAQSLSVGLMNVDRPPYYWKNDAGEYQGLFIEVLENLSKETGISFSYQALPQARIRLYMTAGKLDVEPGVDSSWRNSKGEPESSVYTDPFMLSEDIFVVSGMKNIEKPKRSDFAGLKFCSVLGFTKTSFDHKDATRNRQELLSEMQILEMLDKGRCDYTLLPVEVLNYLQQLSAYSVTRSDPVALFALRLRLHQRHKKLVPALNTALDKMKQDGRMAAILECYQHLY